MKRGKKRSLKYITQSDTKRLNVTHITFYAPLSPGEQNLRRPATWLLDKQQHTSQRKYTENPNLRRPCAHISEGKRKINKTKD
jgi:hypothetical protein